MEMVGVDGEAGVRPNVLVKGGTPAWVDEVNVGLAGEVEIGSRRSLVSPAGKGWVLVILGIAVFSAQGDIQIMNEWCGQVAGRNVWYVPQMCLDVGFRPFCGAPGYSKMTMTHAMTMAIRQGGGVKGDNDDYYYV
jgi:hypothetical protein